MPVRSKRGDALLGRVRGDRGSAGEARRRAPTVVSPSERQLRSGDLPQDQASYSCACGYVFTAPVSASVRCPHCGDIQAW